jgi:DNA mismatch endonuclease (patch repair protein)
VADTLTITQRSAVMARVRNRNTAPEVHVRKVLHRAGYRFRLHRKDLPGTPDIFLPRHRLAIFVHGCFWHGHPGCRRASLPTTRADFWKAKIERNMERDAQVKASLIERGFRVLTLWTCEVRDEASLLSRVDRVAAEQRS